MHQQHITIQQILQSCNQKHILQIYNNANQQNKKHLSQQIFHLNKKLPGGIKNYYQRSKQLVSDAANSVNPYIQYQVNIPSGVTLNYTKNNLQTIQKYQKLGMKQFQHTAFVLVAGGLGQRLGYPGIKINIPFDLHSHKTFIQYYIQYILSFQKKYCPQGVQIPLFIMTSADTHARTLQVLQKNHYFGMKNDQIIVVQQEKVPCIMNNQAHFSVIQDQGKLVLQTKPHGHGDIHTLLYMSGSIEKWHQLGKKWLIFFQDTNPLSFRCYSALLGVTVQKGFQFNSVAVSRKPGQAVGAITSLVHKQSKKNLTINVQYNQLKSLFKQNGQQVDHNGYSKYPGNTNSFVIQLSKYRDTLNKTQGIISQFINPKYADQAKTRFKGSTRLECMMQDYPKLLDNCDKVGYTSVDKGFCFTTLKNDPKTAITKFQSGLSAQSAGSCQAQFYFYNRQMLRLCGAQIQQAPKRKHGGIQIPLCPMISISPKFATCITQMRSKVKRLQLTSQSSLILSSDCILQNVQIDGHTNITQQHGQIVNLKNQSKNYKSIVDLHQNQKQPYLLIRGYNIK